jgi:hypothetical protein
MPEELKILKNIPFPKPRRKYPFKNMKVGDAVPSGSIDAVYSAYQYGIKHKKKFVSRKQKDGTYMIWRRA